MKNQYRIIFEYEQVVDFLGELGITTLPNVSFKKELKSVKKQTFEQNLKATIPQLLVDNGKSIIYRPNNSKVVSLRKVRVSTGQSGKSTGFRCYIILDKSSELIVLTALYTHSKQNTLPKGELRTLKDICNMYVSKLEG